MTSCKPFIPPHQVRGRCEGLPSQPFDCEAHNQEGPAESKYHCSPSPSWKPPSPLLSPSNKGYRDFESDPIDRSIYPSPPSTSLQPGRSVPLPNAFCGTPGVRAFKQTFESYNHSLGPHSPPNLERKALNFREPLSPPPTLPTQTLSLPPAEQDLTPFQEMQIDHDLQSLALNPLVTGDDGTNYHLLSPPLSPEGTYEKSDDSSFSLPQLFFTDTPSSPLLVSHEIPGPFQDGHSSHLPNFRGPHSSRRLWPPPANFTTGHGSSKPPDTILTTSYLSAPQLWHLPEDMLDPDMTPWDYMRENIPMTASGPPHILTPQNFDNTSHALSPPFFYPSSPPLSSPASSDHEFDYHDYDDDGLAAPLSPPSSPSLRSFSDLPMVEDDENHSPALDDDHYLFGDTRPVPPELSQNQDSGKAPTIRSFPGVETDDDLIPLDLASRSSAPEHCIIIPSTPYITPSTFLPLSAPAYSNDDLSGLLLYDAGSSKDAPDATGVELDNLDPMLVASDPELGGLLDLRKRVLASEKRVGMVEDQYKKIKASWLRDTRKGVEGENEHEESRAQLHLAMQAKKVRKTERERLGEINALVKIKLKQKGVSFEQERSCVKDESDSFFCVIHDSGTDEMAVADGPHKCGHHTKANKDNITSMPQLLARMMLRRREARLHPLKRPGLGRSDRGTSSAAPGRAARRRRGSLLALAAPPNSDQRGRANDAAIAPSDASISCNGHHDTDYSPLHWHMDIDCHACPNSTIGSLDDLDLTSPFKMLSLSDG